MGRGEPGPFGALGANFGLWKQILGFESQFWALAAILEFGSNLGIGSVLGW